MKTTITVYHCDWCNIILSDDEAVQTPHLSISIGPHSGWWEPSDIKLEGVALDTHWEQTISISPGIYHFCAAQHLARWIESTGKIHREEQKDAT
ncbi:hypothetical protein LCGC14_0442680 [marine sediment metagenome]|uniref:Uncharacterized protein n=1 Tax=marine sediment metagenome TaxID=412755 RepID=A0A0F9VU76_9ZZZZ